MAVSAEQTTAETQSQQDAPRLPGGRIVAQTHKAEARPVGSSPYYTDGHEFLAHAGGRGPDGTPAPRMSVDATNNIQWQELEPFNAIPPVMGPPERMGEPSFTAAAGPDWSDASRSAVSIPRMHASAVDPTGCALPSNPPYQQQGLVGSGAGTHANLAGYPFGGHPSHSTTLPPVHPADLIPYASTAVAIDEHAP